MFVSGHSHSCDNHQAQMALPHTFLDVTQGAPPWQACLAFGAPLAQMTPRSESGKWHPHCHAFGSNSHAQNNSLRGKT